MNLEIDAKSHGLFCFGKYVEAPLPALSKSEQKIYNMVKSGFSYDFIAKRMSIVPHSVSARVAMIKKKGWAV